MIFIELQVPRYLKIDVILTILAYLAKYFYIFQILVSRGLGTWRCPGIWNYFELNIMKMNLSQVMIFRKLWMGTAIIKIQMNLSGNQYLIWIFFFF